MKVRVYIKGSGAILTPVLDLAGTAEEFVSALRERTHNSPDSGVSLQLTDDKWAYIPFANIEYLVATDTDGDN